MPANTSSTAPILTYLKKHNLKNVCSVLKYNDNPILVKNVKNIDEQCQKFLSTQVPVLLAQIARLQQTPIVENERKKEEPKKATSTTIQSKLFPPQKEQKESCENKPSNTLRSAKK